ncbi:MAG TPA: hydrolase [Candidatus Dormibacteraeota bacterium]|nr:hydrolase [Candidatus Dormibacteraeota bacterium]
MKSPSLRINRSQAGLLVLDLQEKLLPSMSEPPRVIQNAVRLLKGAEVLQLPVFATEQYRKGLGPTVPEIARIIPGFQPFEKIAFSACGADGLDAAFQAKGLADVILCGIETHVCVCHTCLDLLAQDLRVFVVADASASRTEANHRFGLDRMRDAGAAIVSTEMILFELLREAGTPDFKRILTLLK